MPGFDAYHKWLGIRPEEQPVNRYRLPSINLFENDPDVIASAADRRMAHVRSFQTGEHAAWSQRILNELDRTAVSKPSQYKRHQRWTGRPQIGLAKSIHIPLTSSAKHRLDRFRGSSSLGRMKTGASAPQKGDGCTTPQWPL